MRQRAVPGTDLHVSEIGFGCGGNAGLMVRGDAGAQTRAVARALELGITYFDVAPDYGDGAAETALGRVLRELGAPGVVVTTKVEVRRGDLGDVAGHVVRSAHDSLRRLGLARLDVLQIHNGPVASPPAMEDGDYHHLWIDHFLGANGAAEGLRRLIAAGDVRHAGFVSRGGDAVEVAALLQSGLFRMVNLSYSLLRPEGKAVLDLLAAHRCGAAVFSPLAGGLLAGDAVPHALARPVDRAGAKNRDRLDRVARLAFIAEASGGMARAAYRFVLAQPGVATVIGGFSSVAQMEEIAAVSGMSPFDAAVSARLDAALSAGELV